MDAQTAPRVFAAVPSRRLPGSPGRNKIPVQPTFPNPQCFPNALQPLACGLSRRPDLTPCVSRPNVTAEREVHEEVGT